jgi:hypothetical protein
MRSRGLAAISPPFVTIVSGSPRDGTAMVMQMLMAGGLAVLVDDVHKAGTPEPHGYYDYEPSLMLDVDDKTKQWVAGAHGKAVKVMPYQLQYLPPTVEYRVVFVCRRIAEILDSWTELGLPGVNSLLGEREAGQAPETEHAFQARLLRQQHLPTVFVRYGDLIASPGTQAPRLVDFLGLPLDVSAMAAAARRD